MYSTDNYVKKNCQRILDMQTFSTTVQQSDLYSIMCVVSRMHTGSSYLHLFQKCSFLFTIYFIFFIHINMDSIIILEWEELDCLSNILEITHTHMLLLFKSTLLHHK